MWDLRHKIRTLVSGVFARHWSGCCFGPGAVSDWLPRVLGPNGWSVGLMADRSASWYFDRDHA